MRGIRKYKIENLLGKTFGSWRVLGEAQPRVYYNKHGWACHQRFLSVQCICGATQESRLDHVLNGKSSKCPSCASLRQRTIKTKYSPTVLGQHHFNRIRRDATKRKLTFTIDKKYAQELYDQQKQKCAYSGLDIFFAQKAKPKKENEYATASLDRIDPKIGYEPGNIQWVHKSINMMKQGSTHAEFLRLIKLVYENKIQQGN